MHLKIITKLNGDVKTIKLKSSNELFSDIWTLEKFCFSTNCVLITSMTWYSSRKEALRLVRPY